MAIWRLCHRLGSAEAACAVSALGPADARQPASSARSFLGFSASLRRDSLNTRLAELAAAAIEAGGGDVDVTAMRDFDFDSGRR